MLIEYYLANGEHISYESGMNSIQLQDIDALAMQYAQKCPRELPDSIFVSVRIYRELLGNMYSTNMYHDAQLGMNLACVQTGVGALRIIPMPMASDAKTVIVGKLVDFERYDIDKIFEETVLKDCEREK